MAHFPVVAQIPVGYVTYGIVERNISNLKNIHSFKGFLFELDSSRILQVFTTPIAAIVNWSYPMDLGAGRRDMYRDNIFVPLYFAMIWII